MGFTHCYKTAVFFTFIIVTASHSLCSLYGIMGHFTLRVSLSLRLSLYPKFGLRRKISRKVKSCFRLRFAERLAETKRRTERSLNPKLINSPVDFACIG